MRPQRKETINNASTRPTSASAAGTPLLTASSNGRLWEWPCHLPVRKGYSTEKAAAPQPSHGRSAINCKATPH